MGNFFSYIFRYVYQGDYTSTKMTLHTHLPTYKERSRTNVNCEMPSKICSSLHLASFRRSLSWCLPDQKTNFNTKNPEFKESLLFITTKIFLRRKIQNKWTKMTFSNLSTTNSWKFGFVSWNWLLDLKNNPGLPNLRCTSGVIKTGSD